MKYYLCNKCGGSILFARDGEQPVGMCPELMEARTSRICGGGYTIELVPKTTDIGQSARISGFEFEDGTEIRFEKPLKFSISKTK